MNQSVHTVRVKPLMRKSRRTGREVTQENLPDVRNKWSQKLWSRKGMKVRKRRMCQRRMRDRERGGRRVQMKMRPWRKKAMKRKRRKVKETTDEEEDAEEEEEGKSE